VKTIKLKKLYILFIIFSIYGCAETPVGKIPDSEYVWANKYIPANYQEVYRRLINGLRGCSYASIEPFLFTDIKEANIDVYFRTTSATTRLVFGVIRIKETSNNNTLVKIGVQKSADNPLFEEPGRLRMSWMSIAEGSSSCD
jgi:hypothetical protein